MTFELVRDISFYIHIVFILSVFSYFIFYNWRVVGVSTLIYRIYASVLVWYIICKFFDGCPLTYLENRAAMAVYGVPFYPDYDFDKALINKFVYTPSNYIPLAIVIMYQLTNVKWDHVERK